MREIKFRIYDKKNKIMMVDWQDFKFIKTIDEDSFLRLGSLSGKWFVGLAKVEDYKPMQYTGLKDKNGVEIYEGDILTAEQYPFKDDGELNYNAEVSWSDLDGAFIIELQCVNPNKSGISNGMCELLTERNIMFEIIGNIHENPNLVEVD